MFSMTLVNLGQIPAEKREKDNALFFSIVDKMLAEVERNPSAHDLLASVPWAGFQIVYYQERNWFPEWATKIRNRLPGLTAEERRYLNERIALDTYYGVEDLRAGGRQDEDLKENILYLAAVNGIGIPLMDLLVSFPEASFRVKRRALRSIHLFDHREIWRHGVRPNAFSEENLAWIREHHSAQPDLALYLLQKRRDLPEDLLLQAVELLWRDPLKEHDLYELMKDPDFPPKVYERLAVFAVQRDARSLFHRESFPGGLGRIPLELRVRYLRDSLKDAWRAACMVEGLDTDPDGYWHQATALVEAEIGEPLRERAIRIALTDPYTSADLRSRVRLTSEQQTRAEEMCMTHPLHMNTLLQDCDDLPAARSEQYIEEILKDPQYAHLLADKTHLLNPKQKAELYDILLRKPHDALCVCLYRDAWSSTQYAAAIRTALKKPYTAARLREECPDLPEHIQNAAERKALEDSEAAAHLRRYASYLPEDIRKASELKAMETSEGCQDLLLAQDLPAAFKKYIEETLDELDPDWNGEDLFTYD